MASLSSPVSEPLASAAASASPLLDAMSSNVKVVGGLWMASSAILTTYSTTKFLKYQYKDDDNGKNTRVPSSLAKKFHLSRPALLTLYRFGGSLLLGLLLHPDFRILKQIKDTIKAIPDFALPAVFLFLANYSNSLALNRIGISLTYTSKCAIPIFTVLLTWIIDGYGALPSLQTLVCLLPIAAGIALASWDSPVFETKGFGYAMISSSAQTALNVCSKKSLAKTGLSGPDGQRAMVAVGLVITIVSTFLMHKLSSTEAVEEAEDKRPPPLWVAIMALTAYHMEYVLSFSFVKMVAPIAYGASDAVRRLCIIISGHYMFGHDRFTTINILGIATALLGALGYAISSHAF